MKKIILTTLFVSITYFTFGQGGSWFIGGNLGFNTSKTTSGFNSNSLIESINWTFAPEVNTFINDNIQLGLGLTLLGDRTKSFNSPTIEASTIRTGGTVYGRYFFSSGSFRPFVGINVSILPGSLTTTITSIQGTNSEKNSLFDFGANLNAGFIYDLNDRFSVLGSFGTLGYSSTKVTGPNNFSQTSTNFGLDAGTLGNRFTLGIFYRFITN